MVRTPDGSEVRAQAVIARLTPTMFATLEEQRATRGGMSRSSYIRWLIMQDTKRIEREKGN